MDQENRVIVLIDMDCFYCQVEEKLNPDLKGKPIAVVQYNPWKGGGIIAVNYVARAMGVTRHMRGDEAKRKCPEIELPSVPCLRGKADITKYRDAGKEVAKVLQKFTTLLERASIDEAYLDITSTVQQRLRTLNVNTIQKDIILNTYALGYDNIEEFIQDVHNCSSSSIEFDYEHAKLLLVGAVIVSEIRAAVYEETGYRCSAGIAHNKILAKLVCGMNKPNKQTVLPKHSINVLYKTLPLKKVKHLGGKFGDTVCEILKISNMGELQSFSEKVLQTKFDDKNGSWLYNIARGVDLEPVQARFNPKSIGCCKQFRGKAALTDLESLKKWLKDLGDEIEDRLEKDALENNRTPKQMVVSFSTQLQSGRDMSSSRSYNFGADDELCGDFFSNKALELLLESSEGIKSKDEEPNRRLKANIKFLGISVGKFEDTSENKKTKKIEDYFGAGTSDVIKNKTESKEPKNIKKNNQNESKEYMLKKYFQTGEQFQESKIREASNNNFSNEEPLTSSLLNQESFFAKFLNTNRKELSNNSITKLTTEQIEETRVTTPVCSVVECGDNNSNDTDYSGSTIELEINKSIAIFDDDPQDVERVSNMRQLLNNSGLNNIEVESTLELKQNNKMLELKQNNKILEPDVKHLVTSVNHQSSPKLETFKCTECGKCLNIDTAEMHADYHFALKLREEEREQLRNEKNNLKITKKETKIKNNLTQHCNKNEKSVASFFDKINDNVPTELCSECGKKVPLEKFGEHLDFHEAQKLNRELNKMPVPIAVNSSVKRKRKSISPLKKSKVPCKSIASFFR